MIEPYIDSKLDALLSDTVDSQDRLSKSNKKYHVLTQDINRNLLDALVPITYPTDKILNIIRESGIPFTDEEQEEIIDNIRYRKEFSSPELERKVIEIIEPRKEELAEANSRAWLALEKVKGAIYRLQIEDALLEYPGSSSRKGKQNVAPNLQTPPSSSSKISFEEKAIARHANVMGNLDAAMQKFEASTIPEKEEGIAKVNALRDAAMDVLNLIVPK